MAFLLLNFERDHDILKSKSPCILLNKNINFDKNETGLKMENPKHGFLRGEACALGHKIRITN